MPCVLTPKFKPTTMPTAVPTIGPTATPTATPTMPMMTGNLDDYQQPTVAYNGDDCSTSDIIGYPGTLINGMINLIVGTVGPKPVSVLRDADWWRAVFSICIEVIAYLPSPS